MRIGRGTGTAGIAAAVALLIAGCGNGDTAKPAGGDLGGVASGAVGTQAAEARSPAPTVAAPAAASSRAAGSTAAATPAPATAATNRPAAAQAAGPDPCRIISKEELEAALGYPLSAGQRGTGPIGEAECAYEAEFEGAHRSNVKDVQVAIYRASPNQARATFEGIRESASASSATDLQGLGDKAYVAVGSGLLDWREVYVLKGGVLFSIQSTVEGGSRNPAKMSIEEKRSKLVDAARTALGRL